MTRFFIILPDKEAEALASMAYAELRDPRDQAVLLIRQELERRGLLAESADTQKRQMEEDRFAQSPATANT